MDNRALAYAIALIVFIADQVTKWWVLGPLKLREQINGVTPGQIEILPIFNFTYTENRGTAFGLFSAYSDAARWTLVAGTAAVAIGVAIWICREKSRADQLTLSLVLGGALGNILDRTRFGYVVDFADLHFGDFRPFLVFNVGDAAISIGVVILLLRAFLIKDERPKENIEHA